MRRFLLALSLIASCVKPETHPGVTRCVTWFFGLGYSRDCATGPSWDQQLANPQGVREARQEIVPPAFYCFHVPSDELLGACRRTVEECTAERGKIIEAVPTAAECSAVPRAWCYGDSCAPTPSGCEAQRAQLGKPGAPCMERR